MSRLGDLTWQDVDGESGLLMIPVGSVEQHGPHLPLDTDSRIATAVAAAVAPQVGALLAPVIAYGASGEHAGFAGTLSIGLSVLELTVVELVRSADHFAGIVLVNGHGGNGAALRAAVATLTGEGRKVLLTHCGSVGADAHAGRAETSLLLHLCPDAVHLDRAQPGATATWADLADRVRAEGVGSVSPNGVLGDPTDASPDEGARRFAEICHRVQAEVAGWAGG